MKTPALDADDYRRMAGRDCPACGKGAPSSLGISKNSCGMIHQEVQCESCGSQWTDVYQLYSYIDLHDKDTDYQVTEPEEGEQGCDLNTMNTGDHAPRGESSLTQLYGDYEDPRGIEYGFITVLPKGSYTCIWCTSWEVLADSEENVRRAVVAHCGPSMPPAETLATFGDLRIDRRGDKMYLMHGRDVCKVVPGYRLSHCDDEIAKPLGRLLIEIERKEGGQA